MEMKKFGAVVAALLLIVVITGCDDKPSIGKEEPKQIYALPSEITLDFSAERNTDGGILITGATNLPDDTRLDAELLGPGSHLQGQSSMRVKEGKFSSEGFTNGVRPWPPGKHKVHVYAYFNGAWQSPEILRIVGEGGTRLKGKPIKPEDRDVTDGDNIVDSTRLLDFPAIIQKSAEMAKPLGAEQYALDQVKHALLTVDGERSATDIEANVGLFMTSPGLRTMGGWSAKKSDKGRYLVSYDFNNGDSGEQQAIWEFDSTTKNVRFINHNAKIMSWTPAD
jgi:hypothetical protein